MALLPEPPQHFRKRIIRIACDGSVGSNHELLRPQFAGGVTSLPCIVSAHFWLSTASVTVTQESVGAMTDEEARLFLAELRWGSREQQVCPECGEADSHYNIRTRRQWRCKVCFHTFSVTSGTPFANQKIGYRKLLLAVFAFVTNQKGMPALALRRVIGGQYRTSFTLLHKIREGIHRTTKKDKLAGVVEMDGAHFSGRKRKPRKKKRFAVKSAPDKYSKQHHDTLQQHDSRQHRARVSRMANPYHPNRRIVIVLRDVSSEKTDLIDRRSGKPIGRGAISTRTAVCRSENATDIEALVREHIAPGTLIRTDELPAYGKLKLMGYTHEVVNHSTEFCTDDGINQNQAESYFARIRRATIGVHHRITPDYMEEYAMEMAWREDVRRMDIKSQMVSLMTRVCSAGRSLKWVNYCRRSKRKPELPLQAAVV